MYKQQNRNPVPPRPNGIEIGWLCGWIVKGLLVLVILAIVGGICAAIVSDNGDTEEPTRVATPRPTARPVQRIESTATSRPRPVATARPRATATATNEVSHQRWLEGQEHRKNVNAFYDRMRQIDADGIVDFEEYLQVCSALPQWTRQLTAARDYVGEYRRLEPKTYKENQGMFDAIENQAELGLEGLALAECQ